MTAVGITGPVLLFWPPSSSFARLLPLPDMTKATLAVVELDRSQAALIVELRDDGIGGAAADTGSGLRGLADRVEAHGGRLQVSSPVGRRTRLLAEIPCG